MGHHRLSRDREKPDLQRVIASLPRSCEDRPDVECRGPLGASAAARRRARRGGRSDRRPPGRVDRLPGGLDPARPAPRSDPGPGRPRDARGRARLPAARARAHPRVDPAATAELPPDSDVSRLPGRRPRSPRCRGPAADRHRPDPGLVDRGHRRRAQGGHVRSLLPATGIQPRSMDADVPRRASWCGATADLRLPGRRAAFPPRRTSPRVRRPGLGADSIDARVVELVSSSAAAASD